MGVLVGNNKAAYPTFRRIEKAELPKKKEMNYMDHLTKSLLENYRAFFEPLKKE